MLHRCLGKGVTELITSLHASRVFQRQLHDRYLHSKRGPPDGLAGFGTHSIDQ